MALAFLVVPEGDFSEVGFAPWARGTHRPRPAALPPRGARDAGRECSTQSPSAGRPVPASGEGDTGTPVHPNGKSWGGAHWLT